MQDSPGIEVINFVSGTAAFNNAGTLTKSVGPDTTDIGIPLNNTGTLEVAAGTLLLGSSVSQLSGSTLTGGAWVIDANTTLSLNGAINNAGRQPHWAGRHLRRDHHSGR